MKQNTDINRIWEKSAVGLAKREQSMLIQNIILCEKTSGTKHAVERQNEEAAQRNQKRVSTVDNHYICFKVEFTNVSNIPT